MNILTVDTLELSKRLQIAGVPQEQADAHVRVLAETMRAGAEELVTKGNLSEAKLELKADIARLEARIEAVELRLTIKLGAFLAVFAGVIIAALRVPF